MKGNNKITRLFLCFFLFFSLLNTSVYAATAQDNPLVSVKLIKDLGNVTELTFILSEKYNLKESNQTLASVPIGRRSNTSFQTKSIKLLKNGDQVQLIGKQDSWYKVKYGSQLVFMPENYVSVSLK